MDVSIKELAETIQSHIGQNGKIVWDTTKSDETFRKLLDSSKIIQFGWQDKYDLKSGGSNTYSWFLENKNLLKEVKFK